SEQGRFSRIGRRGEPRQAARLLSAEFPFSVGRLDDGRFGKAIRYAGRGTVQRDRKCNATAGAPAVARGLRRSRSAPAAAYGCRLRNGTLSRFRQTGLA